MTMLGVRPSMLILDEGLNEPKCEDDGWLGLPDLPCPNAATWQYRMTCGHPALVCDHHRAEMLGSPAIQCECGKLTQSTDLLWRHL